MYWSQIIEHNYNQSVKVDGVPLKQFLLLDKCVQKPLELVVIIETQRSSALNDR